MKQMIKNKKVLLLIGLMITILFFLVLITHNRDIKGGIDYHCSTSFRMQYNNPDFSARLNIFLQLQKNGTAFFDIIGKADYFGKNYDIARTYHFNYQKESDLVYHLTQISTSRRSPDTVDDNLMNSLFFSTTQKGGQYMRMTRMENSYIINNLHSPLFICIIN